MTRFQFQDLLSCIAFFALGLSGMFLLAGVYMVGISVLHRLGRKLGDWEDWLGGWGKPEDSK